MIIDADTHFYEPRDLWDQYLDPSLRGRGPKFVTDEKGVLRFQLGDKLYPRPDAVPHGINKIYGDVAPLCEIKGSYDPQARLDHMDASGVDVNVIYPTVGMMGFATGDDGELAAGLCRAFNRWAADFASADPARLKPTALLPFRHPELARAELRFARETLGLEIAFANPTPSPHANWHAPDFDNLWKDMEDLDVVMTFHEGTGASDGRVAKGRYSVWAFNYLCGHVVETMLCAMDVTLGGVLARHPKLRVGFIEAHIAWVPGWLALMDDICVTHPEYVARDSRTPLEKKPSEYFLEQCYVTAFTDESGYTEILEKFGDGLLALCSDYPHSQARATTLMEEFTSLHPEVPEVARAALAGGNMSRILGLSDAGK